MAGNSFLQDILEANQNFRKKTNVKTFEAYRENQSPVATMVMCSDSRLQLEILFSETINKIFVVRNIGNQIMNNQGSVDYGVLHLKTPYLLIIGHTNCGAIKTALTDYSQETSGIVSELNSLQLPLKNFKADFSPFLWQKAVEANVDFQVSWALERYTTLVKANELAIIGLIYDLSNYYGKGFGRIYLKNINGEKEPAALLKHNFLQTLSPEEKNLLVAPFVK